MTDFHAHLAQCTLNSDTLNLLNSTDYTVCASCHTIEEFERTVELKKKFPCTINLCFGVLPQNPDSEMLDFLESLLSSYDNDDDGRALFAVGECGFDLRKEFRDNLSMQRFVFERQLSLAVKYDKAMVIHCVKAMNVVFEYADELKKLPSVIFHGFSGSLTEADSLLKRGVDAYFSFGKNLLRRDRNALDCYAHLEKSRILFETDAPYQLDLSNILLLY